MIVGSCGFGSTGSSVVNDYLLEFGDVNVIDSLEFTWVCGVDGLVDLEYHVMHPHFRSYDSVVAIERFKKMVKREERLYTLSGKISTNKYREVTSSFIDSITTTSWDWYNLTPSTLKELYFDHFILERKVVPFLEKKFGKRISCYPMKRAHLSVCPENFYTLAKKHVHEMLKLLGANFNKCIVLDQPFAAGNPQASFPFFEDPYAIVVDRDPRDNYIFAKTKLLARNHYMPVDKVEDFVKYYRAIRDNQPYKEKNDRILVLQFEDLIYNYDEGTRKIREFLSLPENPNPKSIFDPSISIANTQVYKRFPQFSDDIRYIEENLKEYLFDFSLYPEPDLKKEMFFGYSPLHK